MSFEVSSVNMIEIKKIKIRKPSLKLELKLEQRRRLQWLLHILIYIAFLLGLTYAGVLVFSTSRVDMVVRRLYAIEFWVITGFFILYFAAMEGRDMINFRRNNNK
ncbi:MAG: hypothetical protein ABIG93_03245 [archaeon]